MTQPIAKILDEIIQASRLPAVEIRITTKNNGFLISFGCAEFVFQDKAEMLDIISAYLEDPIDTEHAYSEHRATLVGADAPPPQYDLTTPGGLAAIRANAARIGYPEEETQACDPR